MNDIRYRLTNYRARAVDVYRREGLAALIRKGTSFTSLLLGAPFWSFRYGTGSSILDHDWDTCLLFDACRYDEFRRIANLENAPIGRRITLGSNTAEFLTRTFSDVQLHDTVYITANPKFFKLWDQLNASGPVFHDTISLLDDWDSEVNTVRPEVVVERTLQAIDSYPQKRLLVHFIQPHTPFLGPTAETIRQRTGKTVGGLFGGSGTSRRADGSSTPRFSSYVDALNAGIRRETIRTAYRETLEILMDACQPLLNSLSGKTVVTADHGEHLGDKPFPFGGRLWGHPPGIRSTALCVVPWIEFEYDERKSLTVDPPRRLRPPDQETINERLRALGYQ